MDYVWEKAAAGDLDTCCDIMGQIYGENPQHWPFGLDRNMMNPGGLYLVKDAHTNLPAGFVGWQEFNEGPIKVGYYSIGILPEFRQRGLAKSAVRQLLAEKSAGVDEVRALIRTSNLPSIGLAESLDIPIEKVAMVGKAMKFLKYFGVPMGVTAGQDIMIHGDQSFLKDPSVLADPRRAAELGITAAGNLVAPHLLGVGAAPGKSVGGLGAGMYLGATGLPWWKATSGASAHGAEQMGEAARSNAQVAKLLIPLLLAGGAGYAGYKAFGPKKEEDRGRIRVTLPTRGPDDQETQVEMPFNADHVGISNALQGQLARDIRRRLHQESKSRTRTRGGKHVDETVGSLRSNRQNWDTESSPALSLN